jgi:hypothetical protein
VKTKALRHLLPSTETASIDASCGSSLPSSSEDSTNGQSVLSHEERIIEAQLSQNESTLQGIPTQALTGLNYALAYTRLDPFDTFPVKLGPKHHKLLHHCMYFKISYQKTESIVLIVLPGLTTHATMMFEELPMPSFNPMRDVWFPLDLSNEASFNAVMAHSAAHLDRMHGLRSSIDALKFKAEAVRIVMTWLNDPARALSDEVFAAVLRLLTFEVSNHESFTCRKFRLIWLEEILGNRVRVADPSGWATAHDRSSWWNRSAAE